MYTLQHLKSDPNYPQNTQDILNQVELFIASNEYNYYVMSVCSRPAYLVSAAVTSWSLYEPGGMVEWAGHCSSRGQKVTV